MAAVLITGYRPAGHHSSYKQADRQARQSQARDIKGLLRPYCHGKPLGKYPLTRHQLTDLCRQWHLYPQHHHISTTAATVLPHPLVTTCDTQPCPDAQEFTVWDPDGAPIFSVGEYDGAAMYGDMFSVYKPGDVYHPVIQLRYDGTIQVGGQVLTGRDVWFLHCLERAGHTVRYCQARLAVTP
jgi:hypothetical protein